MKIDGKPACSCLYAWIPAFEAAIGRNVVWWQLIGDAPASKGFHRDGGSADCGRLSDSELRIARNMGGAAWNRTTAQGFDDAHCHIRLNGCPHNRIARPQVEDINKGHNGLGALGDDKRGPDDGPRDGVHWPLRTWQDGIEWSGDMSWEQPIADTLGTSAKADDTEVPAWKALTYVLTLGRQILSAVTDATQATQLAQASKADWLATTLFPPGEPSILDRIDQINSDVAVDPAPLTDADIQRIARAVVDVLDLERGA